MPAKLGTDRKYNKDKLREYVLLRDPQELFSGGWFFKKDIYGNNDNPQSWLVPGMVFEHTKTRLLVVVEYDRTLAEVSGTEAEEIRAVLWEYDYAA